MKQICLFVFLFMLSLSALAQDHMTEKKYQEIYDRNIQKQRLYGVYIPADLTEAFEELTALSRPEDLNKFKVAEENMVVSKLHFGLGKWIIHNWNFYEGSRFSHWLKQKGLNHPDDMARVVLTSFHRSLNKKELNLEEQIEVLEAKREKERAEKAKKAEVEVLSKRKLSEKEIQDFKKKQ